ncbi:hypothetical protein [Chitinophaga pinensis]|uniref:Uncharacterized protein n=1 Tax=Chitinophaga pinensis (strain ATCC 43595 / DSM 2588 / LMG 13176 / NBRC 15968 / NCIMB 11800 / UQM 2034) TaxID=485918 RepID=A0A979G4P7_CHIPD|nr:hypothetical protein [Chitinophaga pinensis]ACU60670.1 hypothetical protein Cpin_3203 [Chitinophaga pinensis DSM 2588]
MKKARIILAALAIFATVGGAFAFKAARFNGQPIWHATNSLTTVLNGKTYATFGAFYTSAGATLYISTTGISSTVYKTTATLPPTTVAATATDGSGATAPITTYSAVPTVTRVTTLN